MSEIENANSGKKSKGNEPCSVLPQASHGAPKYFNLLEKFSSEGITVQYGKDDKSHRFSLCSADSKTVLYSNIQNSLTTTYSKISKMIEQKYKGRDFEFLIAELLRVQGFQVQVSAVGPDGGVDVLASSQRLGSDLVKMCVQVKSSVNPLDYKILSQFSGVIHKFNATCGLLVCWGGFSQTIRDEQAQLFFKIKLWSKEDVVRNFLMYYPQLDKKYRQAIPLRQVWGIDMATFKRNNGKH